MNKNYSTLACWQLLLAMPSPRRPVDTAMISKIRNEGLSHSKVMETAFYLTDASGPRISGLA